MSAAKKNPAAVDVRFSRLQTRYASLQEITTFFAKVIVQMQLDRLQVLTLPAEDCKSYFAFKSTAMQEPRQESLVRQIADKGCDSLFQPSVGQAKERETIGWVMLHDRHPCVRPGEWSRQVLIELSNGEALVSRFRQSCHKHIPGSWQGVPNSTNVIRWHELPLREPLERLSQPVKQLALQEDEMSSVSIPNGPGDIWPMF